METLLQSNDTFNPRDELPREGPALLAIDLGGTYIRIGVAQSDQFIDQETFKAFQTFVWPEGGSAQDDVQWIVDRAREVIDNKLGSQSVLAAGISLAANLDGDGNVAIWPNRRSWDGLPIQTLLQQALDMPVRIEDDANAAALAESKYGAGQGYRNVMVVTVGTGIGAGLILDGHLHHGAHRWAGELGHITVQLDGPLCRCGKQGCLQVVASGQTLDRIAHEHGLTSGQDVSQAAERHEPWAQQAIEQCARWLGIALANATTLLDLDAIVLGGSVLDWPNIYWTTLETTFRKHLLHGNARTVPIQRARLAESAGLHGALDLAMSALPVTTNAKTVSAKPSRDTDSDHSNRVAVSLALPDTDMTLDALHAVADQIGLAEVCLDMMQEFDLPRLVRDAPCPLIVTCRPVREGGSFAGPESKRLAILSEAMRLNCAYVDVEWDSIDALADVAGSTTQRIVSKHWFDGMPKNIWDEYERLRAKADVVKLAVTAHDTQDALQVLNFLAKVPTPAIAMAMGEPGKITRLLAPCFANSILTFGSLDDEHTTAPGQLSVQEMNHTYRLDRAGPETRVTIHLQHSQTDETLAAPLPQPEANADAQIHLPWTVAEHDIPSIRDWARQVPNIHIQIP